jgi:hypothetical protein
MKDELRQKNKLKCRKINTENTSKNGNNWTVYYKNKNKNIFDSYENATHTK